MIGTPNPDPKGNERLAAVLRDADLKADRNDLKIVKVPVLDTGIGREAGYENDAALIEAARKEREALSPEVREMVERMEAELQRRILFGDES